MTDCMEVRNRIEASLAGLLELNEDEWERHEAHLDACPDCQSEVLASDYDDAPDLAAVADRFEVPEDLEARVRTAIAEPVRGARVVRFPAWAAAIAAAILLSVLYVVPGMGPSVPGTGSTQQGVTASTDTQGVDDVEVNELQIEVTGLRSEVAGLRSEATRILATLATRGEKKQ